jgi:hypothetical protein
MMMKCIGNVLVTSSQAVFVTDASFNSFLFSYKTTMIGV